MRDQQRNLLNSEFGSFGIYEDVFYNHGHRATPERACPTSLESQSQIDCILPATRFAGHNDAVGVIRVGDLEDAWGRRITVPN